MCSLDAQMPPDSDEPRQNHREQERYEATDGEHDPCCPRRRGELPGGPVGGEHGGQQQQRDAVGLAEQGEGCRQGQERAAGSEQDLVDRRRSGGQACAGQGGGEGQGELAERQRLAQHGETGQTEGGDGEHREMPRAALDGVWWCTDDHADGAQRKEQQDRRAVTSDQRSPAEPKDDQKRPGPSDHASSDHASHRQSHCRPGERRAEERSEEHDIGELLAGTAGWPRGCPETERIGREKAGHNRQAGPHALEVVQRPTDPCREQGEEQRCRQALEEQLAEQRRQFSFRPLALASLEGAPAHHSWVNSPTS